MKPTKFGGVFEEKKKLWTVNATPGKKVYDEVLLKIRGTEYRSWNPNKSKLAAAISKGTHEIGIIRDSVVLYLGASYGTTISHVSDIASDGFVFGLDFAPRVMRELVFLSQVRQNIAPILADANRPQTYAHRITAVDTVYMDIAQKNQAEIFLKNVDMFLKKGGYCLLAVKARSVDVTKRPRAVYDMVRDKLAAHLKIIDSRDLGPFEQDHMMFVCRKK
jgi:fibrillarin-like pre-rRNA processing protein